MNYKLRIFIAGSKKLIRERDAVIGSLTNVANASKGDVAFEIKSYEDFEAAVVAGGQQTQYNQWIENNVDFTIFILDNKVGGITREEFFVAYKSYIQKGVPEIYVYSHKQKIFLSNGISQSIEEVKQMVSMRDQYYVEYTDITDLKYCVYKNFIKFADHDKYILWLGERQNRKEKAEQNIQKLTTVLNQLENIVEANTPKVITKGKLLVRDLKQEFLIDQDSQIQVSPKKSYKAVKIMWLTLILAIGIIIGYLIPHNNTSNGSETDTNTVISIYDSKQVQILRSLKTQYKVFQIEQYNDSLRYLVWTIKEIEKGNKKPFVLTKSVDTEEDVLNNSYRFNNNDVSYVVNTDYIWIIYNYQDKKDALKVLDNNFIGEINGLKFFGSANK